MFHLRTGQLGRPVCGEPMRIFEYRMHDLFIDFCPNEHGYWLDRYERY